MMLRIVEEWDRIALIAGVYVTVTSCGGHGCANGSGVTGEVKM